jgi:hypothetical protein
MLKIYLLRVCTPIPFVLQELESSLPSVVHTVQAWTVWLATVLSAVKG